MYNFADFKPMERSSVAVSPVTLSSYVGTHGFVKVAMDGNALTVLRRVETLTE